MEHVVIPSVLRDEMVAHCRSGYPFEACGLLGGRDDVPEAVYPVQNLEQSNVSYFMDPAAQFSAMKQMRARGQKLLAIFHSHPASPPCPSPKDVRLAFYDDVVYLIVGLVEPDNPEVRAFRITGGETTELRIVITE